MAIYTHTHTARARVGITKAQLFYPYCTPLDLSDDRIIMIKSRLFDFQLTITHQLRTTTSIRLQKKYPSRFGNQQKAETRLSTSTEPVLVFLPSSITNPTRIM
jgi:hypothetical protein